MQHCMPRLAPSDDLVHEVATAVNLPIDEVTDLHSTIWEDNVGALTLAQMNGCISSPSIFWNCLEHHNVSSMYAHISQDNGFWLSATV